MSEIATIEQANPVALYNEGGLEHVIKSIEAEVLSHVPNIATASGRKHIASLAYKVSQSKVALDAMGKTLTEEWKEKSKRVDAERKRMRDRLDALRDKVREPLTKWEEDEKARVGRHQEAISEIERNAVKFTAAWRSFDIESVKSFIDFCEATSTASFEEFQARAEEVIKEAVADCKKAIETRMQHDAEQEELDRLRKEEERRKQEDRDRKIAQEAEERAKREAEEIAKRKEEAVERERLRLEKEKLEAELRAKQAEEKAARDAEEAVEAERRRVAAEKEKEDSERRRREENAKVRAAVRRGVINHLIELGADTETAERIFVNADGGHIPGLIVRYY